MENLSVLGKGELIIATQNSNESDIDSKLKSEIFFLIFHFI